MLSMKNSTWVTSDTHYGHKNIVKFQQRPESHEVIMLSEWIKVVKEDDYILHLGDVWMGKGGNSARWASVLSLLPGRKYLLLGNHDKDKVSLYERAGFTIMDPFIWNGVAFTHRPITPQYPMAPRISSVQAGLGWHTNIHGHIHGNVLGANSDDYNTLKHDGAPIEGKRYINVSVEVTDFRPRQVGGLL